MSCEYSENKLVQDSAGNLLCDELGWEVCYVYITGTPALLRPKLMNEKTEV